jgi:hypothetical protein
VLPYIISGQYINSVTPTSQVRASVITSWNEIISIPNFIKIRQSFLSVGTFWQTMSKPIYVHFMHTTPETHIKCKIRNYTHNLSAFLNIDTTTTESINSVMKSQFNISFVLLLPFYTLKFRKTQLIDSRFYDN